MYRQGLIASGWSVGFIGALLGGGFGVAGFGSAIAGTLPFGAVGYILGQWLWYREDRLLRESATTEGLQK